MISFRSKITQKVLGYFMLHPQARMYINELARKLDLDSGNLTRKLLELERIGVLQSERLGKERFFSLNDAFPLLEEYRKIVLSTVGIEKLLRTALESVEGIHQAFLFGSYVKDQMDAASDIDLLVVGEHNTTAVYKALAAVQKEVDREINTLNFDPKEFAEKKKTDNFIQSVLGSKTIQLI